MENNILSYCQRPQITADFVLLLFHMMLRPFSGKTSVS